MFFLPTLTIMYVVKGFYTVLLTALLLTDAVFLGLGQEQIIVALIGALSGSFLLQRFRKATGYFERAVNVFSSAIAGLFIGAAIIKYFNIEAIQYVGATFFLTSFLVLIFLKALFSVSESNAKGIVTTILRSYLKIDNQVVEKKTKVITTGATDKEIKKVHEQIVTDTVKTADGESKL